VVPPAGVSPVAEADWCGAHGRTVARKGHPYLVPGFPEVLVLVDELPDRLPDPADRLPRESLDEVVRVDQPIGNLAPPRFPCSLSSVFRPLPPSRAPFPLCALPRFAAHGS